MPLVDTRAGTLAYQDSGEGPIVVLLHATLHDHHDFDAILPALEQNYRVIAVDWPGSGESPPAAHPEQLAAALFADGLEDLVDHLDAPSMAFIGNSVGGFAAARLAITRPHQVKGLVLVNSGGFIPLTTTTRLFCGIMGTPWFARLVLPRFARIYMKPQTPLDHQILDGVIRRAKTEAGVQQAAALWRSFATDDNDLRWRSAELAAPTLIVWGRRDKAVPLSAGRATHASLPGSQFALIDSGHVPFASAPDEFLARIEPFLTSVLQERTTQFD
jgi:pimeloyl-ACP methyl ester carboxylesterase